MRGIPEGQGENIKGKITVELALWLELPTEDVEKAIQSAFRLKAKIPKNKKFVGDCLIIFKDKEIKNKILHKSREKSWNVNGMNDKGKRNRIEHVLKKEGLDIICLQETHIARKHKRTLINSRLGNEFISSDQSKKRGVVIYIKKQIEAKSLFKDEEGRISAVQINWQGEKIIIVGIYAPNVNKSEFYGRLEERLSDYADQKIILLGDMNGVVSLEVDRLRDTKGKEGKLPRTFFSLVQNCNLVDIWRFRHPLEKQYTFYSEPNDSSSRLDQIWVSKELVPRSLRVEIQARTISDHNPIKMEL
uniref:exodeoxyribonuclease III n=1 Tax=Podarcis muralis TaxID=64176 RepID=A0A670I952_PODMU